MKKLLQFLFLTILITSNLDISKLNFIQYQEVKATLKTTIANRMIKKPTYVEVSQWINVLNRELKGCKLNNVTKLNLIDKLNLCL